MALWRCMGCGKESESDKPACADCGTDAAKNKRDESLFFPLVLHHFDPPSKVEGRGLGHAACDSRIRVGAPNCAFTGEPSVVNCAKCKASDAFVAAGGKANGVIDIPLKKSRGG